MEALQVLTNWNLMLALVHVAMGMACARLFCTAPDMVQKLVLLTLIVSALLLFSFYLLRLFGELPKDSGAIIGGILAIEHIGVILYIMRLALVESGVCKKSSQQYRPFRDS